MNYFDRIAVPTTIRWVIFDRSNSQQMYVSSGTNTNVKYTLGRQNINSVMYATDMEVVGPNSVHCQLSFTTALLSGSCQMLAIRLIRNVKLSDP